MYQQDGMVGGVFAGACEMERKTATKPYLSRLSLRHSASLATMVKHKLPPAKKSR